MPVSKNLEELQGQVSLAMAALGIAFAKSLLECKQQPLNLENLREHAQANYEQLRELGALDAMVMFGSFVTALHDRKLFPTAENDRNLLV
ncbi:MAG: hypothetical protein ACLP7P_03705 [Rhodomicrobium sp.]